MNKLFRIASSEFINDISGTGAKLHGGRWNQKGTALLYCSEHVSLAILEILVHFDALTIPDDLSLLKLKLPEAEIKNFSVSKFKKIQSMDNAEYLFKEEGEKWIKSNSSLALKVPSIITLEEFNVLINPAHPKFKKLKVVKAEDLVLDNRLFKK